MILPVRPLKPIELAIAEGIGKGLPYKQIAALPTVRLGPARVRLYAMQIAAALPDDMEGVDARDVGPYRKVSLWWNHGLWEAKRAAS